MVGGVKVMTCDLNVAKLAYPLMAKVKGLAEGSSLAMVTVAMRGPGAVGLKAISKPEVSPTSTTVEGCRDTVKSVACAPVMATLGLPLRFRAVAPELLIVKP